MKTFSLILAASVLIAPRISQAQVQGPMYTVHVRGIPMNCTSNQGVPVAIFFDYQLNNVGVASTMYNGTPTITINPNVTNNYSNIVAQWWFAHECAHHALGPYNSESNADCFGVQQLVQFGILNSLPQLRAFRVELRSLAGSPMGHLPGPLRADNIVNCALG